MKDTKKSRAFEGRREREFYSYYEAIRSLSDKQISLCDLNDPESVAAHRPISSADKALTAFTQLAALRLRTRRAMLFFFDVNYAYVLAEATRTLSLQDESRHEIDDGLWLGATKIPRGFSVCEVTVNLPANGGSNAADPASSSVIHIINDLREDTRFCDRPYVQGGPLARFYAGVPITTPKGINIGALCVLDDKTRDGLTGSEIHFLQDMAATVMTHLEMVRAKAENQRSRDMTVGLGAFISGRYVAQGARSPRTSHGAAGSKSRRNVRMANILHTGSPKDERQRKSQSNDSLDSDIQGKTRRSGEWTPIQKEHKASPPVSRITKNATPEATQEDVHSANIRGSLGRAAEILRNAMDVSETLFIDTSAGALGGLSQTSQDLHDSSPSRDASPKNSCSPDPSIRMNATTKSSMTDFTNFCPILAISAPTPDRSGSTGNPQLPEKFLKGLLRHYPRGRVWNFNEELDASSDELSGYSSTESTSSESAESALQIPSNPSNRTEKRIKSRIDDRRMLQKLFPGLRSCAIVGLFDNHKDRWFACAIVCSYSPTRVFSAADELNFLTAFCDVVLADISRIESEQLNQAKNNFISSISHELRSPLHGILGGAECLQALDHDNEVDEILKSIYSCGLTLLDVVNNLLDYSQVNKSTLNKPAALTQTPDAKRRLANAKSSSELLGHSIMLENQAPLDTLTEDAVEIASLGFSHRSHSHINGDIGLNMPKGGNVAIMLDIDRANGSDWNYAIPNDTWKRICINLVNNALKFTPMGHVAVTLAQTELDLREDGTKRADITLTVSDSGVGMSKAFKTESLFKPFRQENELIEGTGLGLNLVSQLVESQSGTIQVLSEKGKGTSIAIKLPLQSCAPSITPSEVANITIDNACVGFVGFPALPHPDGAAKVELGRHRLLNSLIDGCARLGIRTYVAEGSILKDAKLHIVLEHEWCALHNKYGPAGSDNNQPLSDLLLNPIIVLCDTLGSALSLKSRHDKELFDHAPHFTWQPLGPAKLLRTISGCLNRQGNTENSVNDRIVPIEIKNEDKDVFNSSITRSRHSLDSPERPRTSYSKGEPFRMKLPFCHTSPEKDQNQGADQHDTARRSSLPTISRIPKTFPAQANPNPPTLLLVDDNRINLRLLTVYAQKTHHPYLTASDGLEAVNTYQQTPPAVPSTQSPLVSPPPLNILGSTTLRAVPTRPLVIIMDINMPIMNGFEATRAIRAHEKKLGLQPPAVIIALTALGGNEARVQARAHGMDLFLTKPVRLGELTEVLRRVKAEKLGLESK